jgi:hypothetical protein
MAKRGEAVVVRLERVAPASLARRAWGRFNKVLGGDPQLLKGEFPG